MLLVLALVWAMMGRTTRGGTAGQQGTGAFGQHRAGGFRRARPGRGGPQGAVIKFPRVLDGHVLDGHVLEFSVYSLHNKASLTNVTSIDTRTDVIKSAPANEIFMRESLLLLLTSLAVVDVVVADYQQPLLGTHCLWEKRSVRR